MGRKAIDLTGQKFGRLTVVERAVSTNKNSKWVCLCECGETVTVFGNDLKRGKTQSCGCIHSEQLAMRNYKHGLSKSRLINIWRGIKDRCYNSHSQAYHNYGGRGITICEEWLDNFKAFYDWTMANGYTDNLTIDRIDVNGDYEPSNCRWVTIKEQQNNRRNNHLITHNGKTQTIAQWSDEVNIKQHTILKRLKLGWTTEKTLSTPVYVLHPKS